MSNFSNNNTTNNDNQHQPKPSLPSLSHLHHFATNKNNNIHSPTNGMKSPALLNNSSNPQKHVLPSLPPPPDSPSGSHNNHGSDHGGGIKLPPISFFNDISRHSESQLMNKSANNNSNIKSSSRDQSSRDNNNNKYSSASPKVSHPLPLPSSISLPHSSSLSVTPGSASPTVAAGNISANTSSNHNNDTNDINDNNINNSISLPSIKNSLAGLQGYSISNNINEPSSNGNSHFNPLSPPLQQSHSHFLGHRTIGNLLNNDSNNEHKIIVPPDTVAYMVDDTDNNKLHSAHISEKPLKQAKEKDSTTPKKRQSENKSTKKKSKKNSTLHANSNSTSSQSTSKGSSKDSGDIMPTTSNIVSQKSTRKKKRKNTNSINGTSNNTEVTPPPQQHQPMYHHDAMMINKNEQNGTRMIIHQHHAHLKSSNQPNQSVTNAASHIGISHNSTAEVATNGVSAVPIYEYVRPNIVIHNDDVIRYALEFDRTRLDEVSYELNDTQEVLNDEYIYYNENGPKEGDNKFSFFLLPELRDKINCILPIYISKKYLQFNEKNGRDFMSNLQKVRKLWGTDIYTDDSDIISILIHCAFIKIEEEHKNDEIAYGNKEVQENSMIIVAHDKNTNANKKDDDNSKIEDDGKPDELIDGRHDVRVEILILPTLQRYYGLYRNGINSREWITEHDGVSISLYSVKVLE